MAEHDTFSDYIVSAPATGKDVYAQWAQRVAAASIANNADPLARIVTMEVYVTTPSGAAKLVEFVVAQTVTRPDHSVHISGDILSGEGHQGLVPDKIRVAIPAELDEPATARIPTEAIEGQ